MDKLKVLNLYAGLGGNRKKWTDVEVTAVEKNGTIAECYKSHFPQDHIVIDDAHQYLLDHYFKFDFIWTSRPCQSHSRARFWGWSKENPIYPDAGLYQEITFLKHHFEGKWVAENVIPYYDPWIKPDAKIGRHIFWSNFKIGSFEPSYEIDIHKSGRKPYEDAYGFDLNGYDIERKDRKLRNCVHPEIGEYILNRARGIIQKSNTKQMNVFDATGGTG